MLILELAALPPTAQLCLKSAARHQGLVHTGTGYVGRRPSDKGLSSTFTAEPVAKLVCLGLLRYSRSDAFALELTDRGIALVDCGVVYPEAG
ncbi:hypothetical protein [Stenotrophomonas sp. B1-1]|uniref:hypothetical protein n=1 Tax=Stenotrophomonas sp. B1-1 TaxID=2710648 RepID=UPI0013D9042E|nr:hypothetical protein [Stenotrophomonas sp. B1-1]